MKTRLEKGSHVLKLFKVSFRAKMSKDHFNNKKDHSLILSFLEDKAVHICKWRWKNKIISWVNEGTGLNL